MSTPHHHRQDSATSSIRFLGVNITEDLKLDYSHTVSSEEGPPASLFLQVIEEIRSELKKSSDSCTVALWRAS